MIRVQIASDVTTGGVEGVRWALLEASHADAPVAPAPLSAPASASAPAPAPAPEVPANLRVLAAPPLARGGQQRIARWQLAITGLGLLAALGLAQRQLGLPELPWLAATAVRAPMPAPPLLEAPAAAPPIEAARVIPAPAKPGARSPADPTLSDKPRPALLAPAAAAAQPERLITARFR